MFFSGHGDLERYIPFAHQINVDLELAFDHVGGPDSYYHLQTGPLN